VERCSSSFREGWLSLREVESYTTVSSPGPRNHVSQGYETPPYVYGEETPDLPQLFLKDGTILNVTARTSFVVISLRNQSQVGGMNWKTRAEVVELDQKRTVLDRLVIYECVRFESGD
jgi:hypothetical protein